MRNRFLYLAPILDYLGALFWTFGFVMLVPLVVSRLYVRAGYDEVAALSYVLPAAVAFGLGLLLKSRSGFRPLNVRSSMLLCGLAWITVSAVGALPFWLALRVTYVDAYFEAVSGFTTTGITMLQGLDALPRSILFWRGFIQWLGGLGILTFFLLVVFTGGSAHRLFSAESHKIFAKRPIPGLFHTLRMLWAIYAAYTALVILLLVLEGLSLFDAVAHAFTALSTGGYSPYDASIAHYQQAGYRHFVAIEYTLIVAMLLGGMNFFIHYRLLTGGIRSLWDNLEMRLWWVLLAGATGFVALDHFVEFSFRGVGETLRSSLFQVVSIMSTTGFATKDIGSAYFPSFSKLVFLMLMVVGGCVGSTGGGIKVLRIGVLLKMVGRQVRRVVGGRSATHPLVVDGEVIDPEEASRIAAVFFAWMVILAVGGGVTALFSNLDPLASASGMFSALGNIGPCYIPTAEMSALNPIVKVTYIVGMLAGRLEIVPVLLLLSRKAWT